MRAAGLRYCGKGWRHFMHRARLMKMIGGLASRFLFASTVVVLASCSTSSGIKTFHDYNPSVDFASYRGFVAKLVDSAYRSILGSPE